MTIVRPEIIETTAVGAAFLAGLATGVWEDPAAISRAWTQDRTFEPKMAREQREELLSRWAKAVAIA
jgi:glycerol kinase